jgi:glycosyltransferase involved in cell wall biosynthesis
VVSDAGGLPETLEGCQGEVFAGGDRDALAGKMRELTENEARVRGAWQSNVQAMAGRFHPDADYQRLVSTYAGKRQGLLEPKTIPP